MTTDVEGNVWIAFWGASVVRRPSLHDGALFAIGVDVPGRPADEFVSQAQSCLEAEVTAR